MKIFTFSSHQFPTQRLKGKDGILNGLELENGGFGDSEVENRLSFEGASGSGLSVSSDGGGNGNGEGEEKLIDRGINAAIVLAAGTFAVTKLVTVDCDYWHVSVLFASCYDWFLDCS